MPELKSVSRLISYVSLLSLSLLAVPLPAWATGSISINSGAAYTNSASAILILTCTYAGGCSEMQFSNDNTNWSISEAYATTKAWTLSSGDGTKTVSVKFKDTAGNWSVAYSNSIVLDTLAPAGSITINNGAMFANSTSVTLNITCPDPSGCSEMRFSNSGIIFSSAEPFSTTKAWTFSGGEGAKVVYMMLKDNAGNWSNGDTAHNFNPSHKDTISLDTAPPATTASPASGTYTSVQSVTLTCNDGAGSGCDKIYYTAYGSTPTTASTIYSGPINISVTTTIKLFAEDKAGNAEVVKSLTYIINQVSGVDITAPGNPSALNGYSNPDGSISLSWGAPLDADLSGYNVYRDGMKINSLLIKAVTYRDTSTANGLSYTYKVTSVDLAGNESAGGTKSVTATVLENIPPSSPTGIKVEDPGTGYSLKVIWLPNTEADIAGYKVYWGTASGVYTDSYNVGNLSSYTIPGLNDGSRYYIVVTASSSYGIESARSIETSAIPKAVAPRPSSPADLIVTGGNSYLALSWQPVSNITGYMVYIGDSDGLYGEPVRTAYPTWTFSSLVNGKKYYIAVSSYDLSLGNRYNVSSESERTTSTGVPFDNDPPAIPSNVSAEDTGAGGSVLLKWARGDAFDIAGYVIAYKESGAVVFADMTYIGMEWSHNITGLTNGKAYIFNLFAYDGSGNFSDPASAGATPTGSGSTRDITPPGKPLLSAVPGNKKVSLKITPPSDSDIDHYNLYVYNLAAGKYMPLASINGLSYEHSTGVDNGKPLVFVATAVDSSGNESSYSKPASAVPAELPGDISLKEDPPVLDRVDGYDVNEIAKGFGTKIGDPNYNPNADLNGDGVINGDDLLTIALNHGKKK